ncbi:MAG TPA: RNA polymerase sigma factor [Phycisphaerae bacterium]|nr:RNA polymerase sigma factor [Phycisphaerae bacterium]HRY69197.1 RNA polymerase sigma factor [Phycisphaerae bacterium]HSA26158.1 RNA polymerase sigma factor [Phycisphaerae bacterium]
MTDWTDTTRMLGRGGRATILALIEFHADYLFGIARALAVDAADAEELVEGALARYLEGGFRPGVSVRTSLLAALVREACQTRPAVSRCVPSTGLAKGVARVPGGQAAECAGTVVAEPRPGLSAVLRDLAMEHRIVIVLRELAGMTYQEMACTLEVPQATVEARLREAREALSKRVLATLGDLPAGRQPVFT